MTNDYLDIVARIFARKEGRAIPIRSTLPAEVVHHHSVALSQRRAEHLAHVTEEDGTVHRPVDRHRCRQPAHADGREHRDVLAVVLRHALRHPLARCRPPVEEGGNAHSHCRVKLADK